MTREPSFVLAGRDGAVVADGMHTAYPRWPTRGPRWLARDAPIILGALPFDISRPTALMRPQAVRFTDALPDWPMRPLPAVRIAETMPAPDVHRARIAAAVQRAATIPAAGLHKVVLARALRLAADGPDGRPHRLRRLVADDPPANAYLVDLTPAGDGYAGAALVGASPELLVARRGDVVTCRPFAGSAPRLARSRRRPGQRRRPGRIGQEPPRARAGGRRDAQGARPAVRRPADRADARSSAAPRRSGT